MDEPQALDDLSEAQLRLAAARLLTQLRHTQALNQKLAHENALLKPMKSAAQSERLSPEQRSLLDEELDADEAAVAHEIAEFAAQPPALGARWNLNASHSPANLPRRDIHHEPASVCSYRCQMKRIRQDVAEKLDYAPSVFTVERHIRGKWACSRCECIVQEPVAAHVIDKGIPTAGLQAQVLAAKHADRLPLYRQESIFGARRLDYPAIHAHPVDRHLCGVQLQPLDDALKADILRHKVLHDDGTPVPISSPAQARPIVHACGRTHSERLMT